MLPGYDTVELAVRAPPQKVGAPAVRLYFLGAPAVFEGLDDFCYSVKYIFKVFVLFSR